MPTVYSTTPPDLARYGTAPPDLSAGYVYPPVVLSARKPVPAPIIKPKTTTVAGAPTTLANPGALNPAPQAGQGPYGKVPGPIEYPTTPYAEGTRIYPGLTTLTPSTGQAIQAQIDADFTPAITNAIWDAANTYGFTSGMGRDQIRNLFYKNQIDKMLAEQQRGIQNSMAFTNELSKLGVDPELAAKIAEYNSVTNAAPDPEAAAKRLQADYLNAAVNPAGGTMRNPLGVGTYGQGYRFPTFPAWRNEPVNPYNPNPFSPNAPNPYASPAGGTVNPNPVYTASNNDEARLREWENWFMDTIGGGIDTGGEFDTGQGWTPEDQFGFDFITTGYDPQNQFGPTEKEQWAWDMGWEQNAAPDPWDIYDL